FEPAQNHIVIVVAPGVARDVRAIPIAALRGIGPVGVVVGGGDDDGLRGWQDLTDVSAARGGAFEIPHLSRVAAPEPLRKKLELRKIARRSDPADVETD